MGSGAQERGLEKVFFKGQTMEGRKKDNNNSN